MNRETTCCFTGHRPDKLPWRWREEDPRCRDLKDRITGAVEEAYERGYRHFLCGMAQGCDLYFCEAVLSLRNRRQGVTMEAAIPCQTQADRWSERERERYLTLVGRCDYETLVQRQYTAGCMQRRNRYMVDRSSLLIAAYDGAAHGGTLYTMTYALRPQLELVILDIDPAGT